ncbi:MAG: HAD family hydrolase [Hyphomicrobiales bacterium]
MEPPIACVLFDLDDTLTDWPAAIDAAILAALPLVPPELQHGLATRFWPAAEQIAFDWRDGLVTDRAYWRLRVHPEEPWRAALPGLPGETLAEIAETFRKALRPPLFDDVEPTLAELSGTVRIAMLSNNPGAGAVLEHRGIRHHFEQVLSSEEGYWKPHPRAFARAAEALALPPARIAYVGDSYDNDLHGASTAGMTAIWLDRVPFDYDRPAGSHRIESLRELPPLIARLNRR